MFRKKETTVLRIRVARRIKSHKRHIDNPFDIPFSYPFLLSLLPSITMESHALLCLCVSVSHVLALPSSIYKIWTRLRQIEHARNISDTTHASASVTRVSQFEIVYAYATRAFESPRAHVRVSSRRATSDFTPVWERNQLIVLLRVRISHAFILLFRLPSLIFIAIHALPRDRSTDCAGRRTGASVSLLFFFYFFICIANIAMHERREDATKFAVKNSRVNLSFHQGPFIRWGTRETLPLIDWSFRVTCALLHVASSHVPRPRFIQLFVSLAPQVRWCLRRAGRKWNFAPILCGNNVHASPIQI